MTKKPTVFMSHNSRDKAFVRRLANKLKVDGIDVWLDEIEIKIGESIHQKVNDGIAKSDFFAIVLSQSSVDSKWVQDELSSASSIEKYQDRGIFILPILIEECDVPPLLLDRRYANFSEDEEAAYVELLDSLFHHYQAAHPDVVLPPASHKLLDDPDKLDYVLRDPSVLYDLTPRAFEELVAELLDGMGYEVTLTPMAKDGGKDIIATKEGIPGTKPETIIVECKRTKHPISVSQIRQLWGMIASERKGRGMIVTTSYFTRSAKEVAENAPIDLVDFEALKKWLDRRRPNGESGT